MTQREGMMETMPNIPLLRKVVEWVEEQDALPYDKCTWNQMYWAEESNCGTVYCVAGKIAHDLHPDWSVDKIDKYAKGVAMQALEIGHEDADRLFHENNSAEDVREVAEWIAGERL